MGQSLWYHCPVNLPPWDVSAACLGLAASQLFAAVRFLRRARSQKEKPLPAAQPPVSVIVPCAGESPELEASVRALLEQEYPGEAEFLFVCPGKEDPAYLKLSSLLGWRKDGKCSLLASGLSPSRSSGKAADLLFAVGRARASSELLLFVDSDLRVRPGWLKRMAGALADPTVRVATSMMLYRPVKGGAFASILRSAWMANGIPYLALLGIPCGQSLAIRRKDFESMGVPELWGACFLEDLALYAAHGGGRTAFICQAMSSSEEDCGLRGLLSLTGKWMFGFRVYAPWVWSLGALTTFAKLWLYGWSWRWASPEAALFLAAADVLTLRVLSRAYALCLEEDALPWSAALCAPLLPAVYAADFLGSLLTREWRWGPYSYRVEGPCEVAAVPSPLPSLLRDNERVIGWVCETGALERARVLESLRSEELHPGRLVARETAALALAGGGKEGFLRLRREDPALLYQGLVEARSRRGVALRTRLMRSELGKEPPLKVLCHGEGPGFLSLCLSRLGHEVWYLELSRPCLRFASRLFREHGADVRILSEASSLAPSSFDAVLYLDSPELTPEREEELARLRACLKPEGRLMDIARLFPPGGAALRLACAAANIALLPLGFSPLADPDTRVF